MPDAIIKAVLFDLDNTLTHRNQSIEAFARYFVRRYNGWLQPTPATTIAHLIKSIDNGGYGQPTNPFSSIKKSIARALYTELNWRIKPSEDELLNCWVQQFPAHSQPMPGALSLLRLLKAQGYQIAVVSNGVHESRVATVKALGISEHIDLMLSSEMAGNKKPEVSIFSQAVHSLALPAEACLFVGDHPVNDVIGAMQAGLKALWLKGFHDWPVSEPMADAIGSLAEVQQALIPNRVSDYA
jgi:putative hydrolase of the HAD superfamily